MTNIFQSGLFTEFLYPFLLMFLLVYAILEKTSILGKDQRTVNAWVSLVVGLIFVGVVFPRMMVESMILFLTVGLMIVFVALMLWGFISGDGEKGFSVGGEKIHKFFAVIVGIALITGIIWASGIGPQFVTWLEKIFRFLFESSWSNTFWGNVLIVGITALVIAVIFEWNPFKNGPFIKLK